MTITVNVTNTGNLAGPITVTLRLDGEDVESKTVDAVDPGQTVPVTFALLEKGTGTHTVQVGDLTATFEVSRPAPIAVTIIVHDYLRSLGGRSGVPALRQGCPVIATHSGVSSPSERTRKRAAARVTGRRSLILTGCTLRVVQGYGCPMTPSRLCCLINLVISSQVSSSTKMPSRRRCCSLRHSNSPG